MRTNSHPKRPASPLPNQSPFIEESARWSQVLVDRLTDEGVSEPITHCGVNVLVEQPGARRLVESVKDGVADDLAD